MICLISGNNIPLTIYRRQSIRNYAIKQEYLYISFDKKGKNLDMIKDRLSYEEKNEITLDDINYVYGLRYLRKKQELIDFIVQGCFLISLMIFFVLLYKMGFIA